MSIPQFIQDILKYTAAGVGVIWVAFYLVKPYLDRSERLQLADLKKAISTQTLPLRLQAHERLVLYIERINPSNMLLRLNAPSYSAQQLQSVIAADVREEFQHNITQQLYVSAQTWAMVRKIKDDTLAIVANAAKALPADASGLELGKLILSHLAQLEEDPYDIATALIREQVEQLF